MPSSAPFRRAALAGRRAAYRAGQRDTTVALVVETYSAAVGTAGATLASTTTTTLDPSPKVERVEDPLSAFGGGLAAEGGADLGGTTYRVGPVTKPVDGAGYDRGDLFPAGGSTKRVYYLLGGDEFKTGGERFRPVRVERETPQSITIVVQRTQQ